MIWVHLDKVIKDLWNQLFSMSRWNQILRKHLYEGSDQFDRIMNFSKTFWSFCATAKWAERKHAQSTTSLPILLRLLMMLKHRVFALRGTAHQWVADAHCRFWRYPPSHPSSSKKRKMQLLAMVKDNVVEVAPRNCLYKDVEEKPTKFWPFIRSYMLSMALQKQHFKIFWESGVAGCIGAR